MATESESFCEDFGTATGMVAADPQLLRDLLRRMDSLYRFDELIANAADKSELQAFWRESKAREERAIEALQREYGSR